MRRAVTGRGEGTAAAERARLARARAEAVELKNARLAGVLLDVEGVLYQWRANPDRRALADAGRSEPRPAGRPHLTRDDLEALDAEIRVALEELAADRGRRDARWRNRCEPGYVTSLRHAL